MFRDESVSVSIVEMNLYRSVNRLSPLLGGLLESTYDSKLFTYQSPVSGFTGGNSVVGRPLG